MALAPTTRAQIERALSRARIPGCSLAVVDGDGLERDAFGFADLRERRPATADTVYHLYSGTKLYTASALMLLRERGQLDLDEPVDTYLDDLDLRHPVTARQLASHDSGLRDTLRGFFAVHRPGEPMPTTAEALARYRTDNGAAPGRGVAYRNVNYAILGELISRVSGRPYTDFVRDELLRPWTSGAAFDGGVGDDVAVGYLDRFSPARWILRLVVPGLGAIERDPIGRRVALADVVLDTAAIGGLIGNTADFCPLVSEFLSERDGLLTVESKREMLTLQATGRAGVVTRAGVGLGWKRGRLSGGLELWNHEGGGPGFTSETRIYPSETLGMVALINTTQSAAISRAAHEICEIVRAARR